MPDAERKELFLVDGHALAYRSYFATIRAPMTNSKGQATGAVLGFANSVLRMLQDFAPPYVAVVFDSPKPTFRHEMYKEYKANREAMPDDMRSQIPLIMQLVDSLNITRLAREGLEADDIIAWLSRRAASEGYTVRILSKDKDLLQLVDDRVHLLSPETGGGLKEMGPAEVKEKMGVAPGQIRDLLALMGDSSDNVPGVPGVGPKTAVKILAKTGDIDTLLKDPSVLKNPKLQAKIEDNLDKIELSRRLVTLDDSTDLGVTTEELAARDLDKHACAELFTELEFQSLLRNPLFDTKEAVQLKVHVPTSLSEVELLAKKIDATREVCVDTETTSTEPREATLVGISLALNTREAWYIPTGHVNEKARNLDTDKVLEALRGVLESDDVGKVGQNLKYDYQVLKNHGVTMGGLRFDTMVAAYVIDPGNRQYGLDALAATHLQINMTPITELIGKGKDQKSFAEVPVDDAAHYSGEDVVVPLQLRDLFAPILKERELTALFVDLEMPLVSVLAEMEWQGIAIDEDLLGTLSKEYGGQLETIAQEIFALAGEEFNLNSPKQIAEVFYDKLGMPKGKKTKTGRSTDVATLEGLAPKYPVARKMLEHRGLNKLLSTYIDALPQQVSVVTGRVHTSFNQTVAATGRLSSTNPNLQNIPIRTEEGARIREAFVAPKGRVLVSADYSQIELRILAHLSGDEFLQQAFHEDKDIHTQTASAIYGQFPEMVTPDQRRAAKTINFGLMYGMGPINLSRQLGISFKEAQEFIDTYFTQFPTIHDFMQRCIKDARDKGYSETMLGRRRYLTEINSERRQIREGAERTAINTPVQGTAADVIKLAMVDIQHHIAEQFPEALMLLQVHDELVFECPEGDADALKAWVVERMSAAMDLQVPLKVDVGVGGNWREAH